MVENLFESGKAAIVHVRGGESDVAKAGSGEGAPVEGGFRSEEAAEVGVFDG